jgi:hypothetical protein
VQKNIEKVTRFCFSNLAFEAFDAMAYLIIEIRAVIVEIDRNCTNKDEWILWHVMYD